MNERDELRGTLSNTICNASNYPPKAMPYLLGGDMSEVLGRTADAILAAGYRKPRAITRAEELDALPVQSVIRHENTALHERWASGWRRLDCWEQNVRPVDPELPVTVLWEPK